MTRHAETARLLIILAIASLSLQSRGQTAPPPDAIAGVEKQSTAPSPGGAQAAPSGSQPSSDEARKEERPKKSKWRVRLGGTAVYGGYAQFPSNFYYPFFPYGFGYAPFAGYAPFVYDPFYWPPYGPYGPNLVYAPDKGEVELDVDQKGAEVYIDDAYAGTAGRLKHLWLQPGAYNLAVSSLDGASFHRRIYVLSGKSVKIRAKLVRQSMQAAPQERQP